MNDKIQHAIAGGAAAFTGAMLYVLFGLVILGLGFPVPTHSIIPVPFITALVAGVTKEVADAMDNRIAPGMHFVDPWDVAATAAPGLLLSAFLALTMYPNR